jgi:hypothetical protein
MLCGDGVSQGIIIIIIIIIIINIIIIIVSLCRLNAAEMFVDVGKTDAGIYTNWVAESGVLDLFMLLGPTPVKVGFACSNLAEMQ